MNKLFEFFGGRKTTFALLLFVSVIAILFLDKCDFNQFSNFVIWVFGSYMIGNGIEHVGIGLKKK
tara:strand:- start:282 stop:476 length:195 start_codon:yes stop_codon:yes gene_type:complete